jgi:hypothetical protein
MIMVKFWMKKQNHDFLVQLCQESGMEMSEMLRSIISYFFMTYTLGRLNMSMENVRKDFLKYMNSIGKYEKRKGSHKNISRSEVSK